jgi:hypothetical protein
LIGGLMNVRASDADRDATVNRLREAAGEGQLTLEELTDRIEAAANAVMRSDLVLLTCRSDGLRWPRHDGLKWLHRASVDRVG